MTRPDFNLLDFSSIQSTNENGEVTTDTSGVSVGLDAIKSAVTNHPDNVDFINRRIDGYNKTKMVEYYQECVEIDDENKIIQEQRSDIAEANANLEEGQEPVELPEYEQFKIAPVALAYEQLSSMSEFKEIITEQNKLKAFTFNDLVCSVTKDDQNGLGAILCLGLTDLFRVLVVEHNISYTPIIFNNDNGEKVPLLTWDEYFDFVDSFKPARLSFFVEEVAE